MPNEDLNVDDQTINEELSIDDLQLHVEDALRAADKEQLDELLEELHGYDRFRIFDNLDEQERLVFYQLVEPKVISEIFENAESDVVERYLEEMNVQEAAEILSYMATDDAVDVLNHMSAGDITNYLSQMDDEKAQAIKDLLFYEEDSAGSIMAGGAITVLETDNVKEAMKKLVDNAPDAETINVIYVLNEDKVLTGVVSLREMILARRNQMIHDIMTERVIKVTVDTDQEDVVRTMRDYDLTVLPVVDDHNYLQGIITIDDAMDILEEEAQNDYYKLAGISEGEKVRSDDDYYVIPSLKKRLPWLVSMIFLSTVVSFIVSLFDPVLQAVTILAPFVTLVNNMTGVPGIQAAAVAMMRVSSGEFEDDNELLKKFIFKQVLIIVAIGIIIAVIDSLCALFISRGNVLIMLIVGVSVFLSSSFNSLVGVGSVVLLHKLNLDPAVASGPLMSTIGDVCGVTVYFTTALVILGAVGIM